MQTKKILTFFALLALTAGLSGCGQANNGYAAAPAKAAVTMTEKETKQEEPMNVKITIGNHIIKARLNNNAAAKKLWNRLPVTFPTKNLYGREMCYRMGSGSLPTKEAASTGYQVGDISYWPPAGSLVILYRQNGEVFEQEPIGHTDDDLSFLNGLGDTQVTWEKDN